MTATMRRAGAVTLSGLLLVVSGAAAQADSAGWSQSGGGPGSTAAVVSPGNLSPSTVTNLALDYSVSVGDYVTQSPAVVGGSAYAGTLSGHVLAISTDTGRTRWRARLCDGRQPAYNGAEETSPAVGAGAVFVLGDLGVLSGVRLAAPHDLVACVTIPGASSGAGWSPTLAGRVVYASTATHLVAVDATTGAVIWTRALPAGYAAASNVVVDRGLAYVAANSGGGNVGHVLAYAAATGQPRWSVRTGSYVSALAAADGRVIVGGWTVRAFDEPSGAVAWTSTVHGAVAVTISGNRVVVAGGEATPTQGALLALDATTGARLWRTPIGSEEESQPSAGGGVTYLTDLDSGTVVMNRLSDGHLLAVISHPGGYYDQLGTPVVVDGHIYLFTQGGSSSNLDRWSTAS